MQYKRDDHLIDINSGHVYMASITNLYIGVNVIAELSKDKYSNIVIGCFMLESKRSRFMSKPIIISSVKDNRLCNHSRRGPMDLLRLRFSLVSVIWQLTFDHHTCTVVLYTLAALLTFCCRDTNQVTTLVRSTCIFIPAHLHSKFQQDSRRRQVSNA